MAIQNDYKVYEVFYNPDIPIKERVAWGAVLGALSPVIIPAAAGAALLSMGGCTSPHEPEPFPTGNEKPRSFVRNKDAGGTDAAIAPEDTYTCIPDPCPPDRIDMSRRKGDQALCISFAKSILVAKAPHRAISVADTNNDGRADLFVITDSKPNALFTYKEAFTFTDSAEAMGLNLSGEHRGAFWGDMDQDKDNDLAMATTAGALLYANTGKLFEPKGQLGDDPVQTIALFAGAILLGTENGLRFYIKKGDWNYEEATEKWGLQDNGSARHFAVEDFDDDGDYDIYVANETGVNRLFENKGDHFQSVEEKFQYPYGHVSSVDAQWLKTAHSSTWALSVANYDAADWFFTKQANGTYSNVASNIGLQNPGNTIRAAWADFLGEKSPAVFLARTYTQDAGKEKQVNLLYVPIWSSSGQVTGYRDIAYPYGMSGPAKMVGAEWGDFNGDGALDLATAAYDGAVTVYINESRWVKVCP